MVRLYFFVEGSTEQTFADVVLKRHLAYFGVYMQKPTEIAHARKKGKVHRGGGRNPIAMQNDINRRLKQESGIDVFVTTMIDLYALPRKFPGYEEAERLRNDPYKRVEALERSWFDKTGDRRFIPFIQLHEFEAYLLADVSEFASFFDNTNSAFPAFVWVVTLPTHAMRFASLLFRPCRPRFGGADAPPRRSRRRPLRHSRESGNPSVHPFL